MSKKIHTIQSSDKKEFEEQVNYFLERGCELLEGSYAIIKNENGDLYSQVIVFKNCKVKFYKNGQIKFFVTVNKNGKKDGLCTEWWENGQKSSEVTYEDGEYNGSYTTWHQNGQKELYQNAKGKDEYGYPKNYGLCTRWWGNGHKDIEATYKDGKFNGLVTMWHDENGQKISESTWKDGVQDGKRTTWWKNGQKESEGTYKDGIIHGLFTEWWDNGNKKTEGNFKLSYPVGKHTTWHENGTKFSESTFKDQRLYDCKFWNEDGSVVE